MSPAGPLTVRARTAADDVTGWLTDSWGDTRMVVHGEVFDAAALPAFVALRGDEWSGLLTYTVAEEHLEIVTCDARPEGQGTGRALVTAVVREAQDRGVRRLRCTTTNDNVPALGFWQAIGFQLVALRPRAVDEARRIKPQIPATGWRGLPIRDEIDLELKLPRSR